MSISLVIVSMAFLVGAETEACRLDRSLLPTHGDGKTVLVAEGDSLSVQWGSSYTGLFARNNPEIEFASLAKGGSGIRSLYARIGEVLALRPDTVSILIGSNDLGSYPSAELYAQHLRIYACTIKQSGAKVVVGTPPPRRVHAGPFDNRHNQLRKRLAKILRNSAWVDGIFDIAADPLVGSDDAALDKRLYYDGLHPTDSSHGTGISGHHRIYVIYQRTMDAVVADVR